MSKSASQYALPGNVRLQNIIGNVTQTKRTSKSSTCSAKSTTTPIFHVCTPHTSDLPLKISNQFHRMLKNAELRQRPIKCHVQHHHAAKFWEGVVDVAHSYPSRGRIKNQEILYVHATCNNARICHAAKYISGCIQNTKSGFPWLSRTFYVHFSELSSTIHLHFGKGRLLKMTRPPVTFTKYLK